MNKIDPKLLKQIDTIGKTLSKLPPHLEDQLSTLNKVKSIYNSNDFNSLSKAANTIKSFNNQINTASTISKLNSPLLTDWKNYMTKLNELKKVYEMSSTTDIFSDPNKPESFEIQEPVYPELFHNSNPHKSVIEVVEELTEISNKNFQKTDEQTEIFKKILELNLKQAAISETQTKENREAQLENAKQRKLDSEKNDAYIKHQKKVNAVLIVLGALGVIPVIVKLFRALELLLQNKDLL